MHLVEMVIEKTPELWDPSASVGMTRKKIHTSPLGLHQSLVLRTIFLYFSFLHLEEPKNCSNSEQENQYSQETTS